MASSYRITISSQSQMDKYPAKTHARRVAETVGLESVHTILLRGEKAETWSNSDMARPFRQDRFFYYLSGSNDPGCWLTYHVPSDTLTLWLPRVNLERFFYDGAATTVEEALERYDIDEAKYLSGKKANCNLSRYIEDMTQFGQCACLQIPRGLLGPRIVNSLTESAFHFGLRDAMIACRAVKDEHEIKLIRQANRVSAAAHLAILQSLPLLTSEPQVEAVYTSRCVALKARAQAYNPICGSGPNASQLHYMDNIDDFGDRQTLLVDAGAEWQCYASDVTRTMPINPKAPGNWQTSEARSLYAKVEHIQETCIEMLGPGVMFYEVAWQASNMAIDALLDLGILHGSRKDIVEAGTWMAFFPHGLGHHLGLEVHDLAPQNLGASPAADPRFKRHACRAIAGSNFKDTHGPRPNRFALKPTSADAELAPGMVVTIEPGIYFNKFALEQFYLPHEKHQKHINLESLARYMHVGGVRIEDDILITPDGYENLTIAPKGERMLQIIRDAASSITDGTAQTHPAHTVLCE